MSRGDNNGIDIKDTMLKSTGQKEAKKRLSWQEQLRDGEVGKDGSTEFVFVAGLRRLSKLKGQVRLSLTPGSAIVLKRADGTEYPLIQMICEVEYEDGTIYSDAADAHTYNVQGIFSAYPTAMAAVRAEARALRKALEINLVSKEELGANKELVAESKNEITQPQLRVIKLVMKKKSIEMMDIIKNSTVRDDIYDITELTFPEGKQAVKYVNEFKESNKK